MARRLAPLSVCLGLLTFLALARSAAAQTYVWTDEHGVVHAAADPGEVPAKYRTKSVQDAERPRSNSKLTVLAPPDAPAAPEADAPDPTVPARMKPGYKPAYGAPPKAEAPAEPTAAAPPADDEPVKPKGLGEPEKGFEWHCTPDPDGGKPKCEQFEKRSSKRDRHAAARDTARKQMGVDPDAENDPETQAELQRRADQEYEKTTVKPPAPKRGPGDDDDESGDSD